MSSYSRQSPVASRRSPVAMQEEFAKARVRVEDIPALLKKALTEGTLIDTQGRTRLVYEVVFNGKSQLVAIDVSSNGFVIGANPA